MMGSLLGHTQLFGHLSCCEDRFAGLDETTGEIAVAFAVAVRPGRLVVDKPSVDSDIGAAVAVLYLTADGEHVVERHIQGSPDDLGLVPRATVASLNALSPADAHAKRYAPVVRRHPEV